MALKKVGLRAKAQSKSLRSAKQSESDALQRVKAHGKVQAKLVKSSKFVSRIQEKYGQALNSDAKKALDPNDPSYKDFSSISKSAARRRKRKLRDALKPQLNDLLKSLPETELDKAEEKGYIEKKKHIPNPHKSLKGKALVEKVETQAFKSTLGDGDFRSSPFAALKQRISTNLNFIG